MIFAKKGPKYYYELYARRKENIGSSSTVFNALNRLCNIPFQGSGLIKIKRKDQVHGRPRSFYGLTFLGLHYLLDRGLISPEKCANVMLINNIEARPKKIEDFEGKRVWLLGNRGIFDMVRSIFLKAFGLPSLKMFEHAALFIKEYPEVFFSELKKLNMREFIENPEDYEQAVNKLALAFFIEDVNRVMSGDKPMYPKANTAEFVELMNKTMPDNQKKFMKEFSKYQENMFKMMKELEKKQ